MKKIIALAIIIAITPHIDAHAVSATIVSDYCALAGVTEGAKCTSATAPSTVYIATACISASAGCTYKNCSSSCACQNAGCPGGGGTITDCSGVTCNPTWGSIDHTTHIQTGKDRKPDTSNNCECKDIDSTLLGSTVYRCIAGYYDTTTGIVLNGTKPTCALCPTIGNNNVAGQSNTGITNVPKNKGITSCYIPYNTEITDDTGTYVFYSSGLSINPGCHYTE